MKTNVYGHSAIPNYIMHSFEMYVAHTWVQELFPVNRFQRRVGSNLYCSTPYVDSPHVSIYHFIAIWGATSSEEKMYETSYYIKKYILEYQGRTFDVKNKFVSPYPSEHTQYLRVIFSNIIYVRSTFPPTLQLYTMLSCCAYPHGF